MTIKRTLQYFAVLFITFSIISCSTDATEKNIDEVGKMDENNLMSKINHDINQKLYYSQAENKYNYSSKLWDSFNKNKEFDKYKSENNDLDEELDALASHYKSLGYDIGHSDELFRTVKNIDQSTTLEDVYENGRISKAQFSILSKYFEYVMIQDPESDFSSINSVFEHHVSSSNLSENEKMGLLTMFDMTENVLMKDDIRNSLFKMNESSKSESTDCAIDVLLPIGVGAAGGNGLGAAGGVLVGLWNAYRNGCMD